MDEIEREIQRRLRLAEDARLQREAEEKYRASVLDPLRERWESRIPFLPTKDVKLLEKIEGSGQTILYVLTFPDNMIKIKRSDQDWRMMRMIHMIITTHHVYCVKHNRNKLYQTELSAAVSFNISGNRGLTFGTPYHMAVYSFDTPLTLDDIQMIKQLNTVNDAVITDEFTILASLYGTVAYMQKSMTYHINETYRTLEPLIVWNARKIFESVIRLIPGSYQNDDWKQLDGFFGMYYHITTRTLSEFPVIME